MEEFENNLMNVSAPDAETLQRTLKARLTEVPKLDEIFSATSQKND